MKTLIAITGWGVALIVSGIGFAVLQHEVKWRDDEILELRAEAKVMREAALKSERDHTAKIQRVMALVEKMKRIHDLENEAAAIQERTKQMRVSRAAMTDLDAKTASILKEANEVARLGKIAEEIKQIGETVPGMP